MDALPFMADQATHLRVVVQVEASEALAHTLAREPLLVTVMRQGTARNGAGLQQPVPVGTAEVDLSCLLRPRCLSQPLGCFQHHFWLGLGSIATQTWPERGLLYPRRP